MLQPIVVSRTKGQYSRFSKGRKMTYQSLSVPPSSPSPTWPWETLMESFPALERGNSGQFMTIPSGPGAVMGSLGFPSLQYIPPVFHSCASLLLMPTKSQESNRKVELRPSFWGSFHQCWTIQNIIWWQGHLWVKKLGNISLLSCFSLVWVCLCECSQLVRVYTCVYTYPFKVNSHT